MKTSLKNKLRILSLFFAIILKVQLFKRGEFGLELERRDRGLVQTQVVEFIALPFPFPNKLKIWSFHVVVVQGLQRNVQENVMEVGIADLFTVNFVFSILSFN